MNLKIGIIDRKPKKREGVISVEGLLEIGDFRELLYMPLDLWSMEGYERQWREGIERLEAHATSCLIATIHDPKIRPFIEWWLLYREQDKVYIQSQLFVGDIYKKWIGDHVFDHETCYNFIPRRTINSPRKKYTVSEWVVDYPLLAACPSFPKAHKKS